MRKKVLVMLILMGCALMKAQFFENHNGQKETSQSSGFFENNDPKPEYEGDNWGSDSEYPTTPGDEGAPIDDYLFLLPLIGIAVGGYYLLRKQKTVSN